MPLKNFDTHLSDVHGNLIFNPQRNPDGTIKTEPRLDADKNPIVHKITHPDGRIEEIPEQQAVMEPELLRDVLADAISCNSAENLALKFREKDERYQLARKLVAGGTKEFSKEELDIIKASTGSMAIHGVGQLSEALEKTILQRDLDEETSQTSKGE